MIAATSTECTEIRITDKALTWNHYKASAIDPQTVPDPTSAPPPTAASAPSPATPPDSPSAHPGPHPPAAPPSPPAAPPSTPAAPRYSLPLAPLPSPAFDNNLASKCDHDGDVRNQ